MHPSDVLCKLQQQFLPIYGEDARRHAEELLCERLSMARGELYQAKQQELTEDVLDEIWSWSVRHAKGEPLPYLSKYVNFYGLSLHITPDVLVPRHETEILVDIVVQELTREKKEGGRLWDVCCGSGCIGLAIKKRCPWLAVTLSDCSPEALTVAQKNGHRSHLEVGYRLGDLLAPFQGEQVEYCVCNPPYVSEGEYALLSPSVRDYEPRLALLGGKDGLAYYKRLAETLPVHLVAGGKVWLEIGASQGEALMAIFQHGPWKVRRVTRDWAGHERFFFLEKE